MPKMVLIVNRIDPPYAAWLASLGLDMNRQHPVRCTQPGEATATGSMAGKNCILRAGFMDSNLIRKKILSGNWAMSKHARVRA